MLEFLSKSSKTTPIHLHYVLHISLLTTFVLETCRFDEFSNKKSLSYGAKIPEFEFLGPWVFGPVAKKTPDLVAPFGMHFGLSTLCLTMNNRNVWTKLAKCHKTKLWAKSEWLKFAISAVEIRDSEIMTLSSKSAAASFLSRERRAEIINISRP